MAAEMDENNGVLECCKIEFEGKADLSAGDLSSCGNLDKVVCNGVVRNGDAMIVSKGDAIIGEEKDDGHRSFVFGSFVFVNGGNCDPADNVVFDEGDRVLNSETVVDQTEIFETKFVVDGDSGLELSVSITEKKQFESEGFGDERELDGESCEENGCSVVELPVSVEESAVEKENGCSVVELPVSVEETAVENSNTEECVDCSQVELDGSDIVLKHMVEEENKDEVRCIEQEDVGVQLESALEEEISQESQTIASENAKSELPPIEIEEEMETLNSADEVQGEDMQIMGNEDMGPQMKLEVDHSGEISEITSLLVDETELEPQYISDKKFFIESESIAGSNVTPNSVNLCGETSEITTCLVDDTELEPQSISDKDCFLESESIEGSIVIPNSVNDAVQIDVRDGGSVNGDGDGDRPIGEEVDGSEEIHQNGTLPSQDPDLSTSTLQLGADENGSTCEKVEESEEVQQNGILIASQEIPDLSTLTTQLGADGDRPICEEVVVSKDIQQDGILPSSQEVPNVCSLTSQLITDGDRPICEEVEGSEEIQQNEILTSQDDPYLSTSTSELGVADVPIGADALDGQKAEDIDVVMKHYMIVIPRHMDNKIRAQIRHAQSQVDEKTQNRDNMNAEIHMKRATCDDYRHNVEAAKAAERAARDAANAKRKEIDSVQIMINKMKNSTSIEEIDDRIRGMEHMIEHETIPLKEEKQLIHEIKQLKVSREQLCASKRKHAEFLEAFAQNDSIEDRFKLLKQEFDSLRNEVLRTESITKAHKKKYADEYESLKELQNRRISADNLRQEAYTNLQNLRKQEYERINHFRQYKEDWRVATDYGLAGDKEALQCHCSNQVEKIMELWNKNDEFRKQYIKDNLRSTLRRFRTLDGRSLGPNEDPPVLANLIDEENGIAPLTVAEKNATLPVSAPEKIEEKNDAPAESESVSARPVIEVAPESSSNKPKKSNKSAIAVSSNATVSGRKEEEEEAEKERERAKEEELGRKAEELRREEAAAKRKEQCRLEEMAKAKQAMERKKRNTEKASARAELKAQKEAELKEKEREKRAKKKARKKASAANSSVKEESSPIPDNSSLEVVPEPETKEKSTASVATKRPTKSSTLAKQAKPKPPVLPPRHRGKRKTPTWVWILVLAAVIFALVLVSNGYTFKLDLLGFGF